MMTFNDYKKYYHRYINSVLGLREQEFDCMNITESERTLFSSYEVGTKVLLMVAFIESNFLNKAQLKSLRKFEEPDAISVGVNFTQLSCFVYIRDCMAHNPNMLLLPDGQNTIKFTGMVSAGRFNFATINKENITVLESSIHQLHLTIRKFYGQLSPHI